VSSSGRTAVVLFTRDLRVHDQPALSEAARTATQVVPLFVLDPALHRSGEASNRIHEPWRSPLARVAPEYPQRLEARHAARA
jgi:deoxyribodipyrimidine photolyase